MNNNFNILCHNNTEFIQIQKILINNYDYKWIGSGRKVINLKKSSFPLLILNYWVSNTIMEKIEPINKKLLHIGCTDYNKSNYVNGVVYNINYFLRKEKLNKLKNIKN